VTLNNLLRRKVRITIKPRLHERFFACDGDAIFLEIVASPARGENRVCSHPHTGDATDEKIAEKKSREIQRVEFFAAKSRSLSEGGNATMSKKWHRHCKQEIACVAAA